MLCNKLQGIEILMLCDNLLGIEYLMFTCLVTSERKPDVMYSFTLYVIFIFFSFQKYLMKTDYAFLPVTVLKEGQISDAFDAAVPATA